MILHILLVLLPLALAKETYFDVLTSPRSLANLFKEFKDANNLQFASKYPCCFCDLRLSLGTS